MRSQHSAVRCCNRQNLFRSIQLSIPPEVLLYTALILLLLPVKLFAAALLAALLHEACHILAIWVCGKRIYEIRIGFAGATIRTEGMSPIQELICALAGPLGGLLTLLFVRWIPLVSMCASVQSLYNLLPVYPSDGGRALRSGVNSILPISMANMVCNIVEWCCVFTFVLLGAYGTFLLGLGIFPLGIAIVLLTRKFSCKLSEHRVQ